MGTRCRDGNARVVWPPQQRESAREAIEELMRERGLARALRAGGRARGARRPRALRGSRSGPPARRDLRELATFTIDPVTARDYDDAISAERLGDGADGGRGCGCTSPT